ncbi:response regulator transcription factor [Aureispira anguillae]|uniref:Response regulator transcription factor n=1 Tax=Aureispira anguillae TaxID=2864201 RepID=A0A915YJP2_9BACT|nr:response regulator transcription factor [Aureispira anguillae]BDS14073.1 response regulator transcription factor [Aureispira anguillae]
MTIEKNIIQLAIVDDEQLIVKLLEGFFTQQANVNVFLSAFSGEEFLEELEKSEQLPDIALLDLRMKELDGIELTSILKEKYPSIRIIVISSYYKKYFMGYMLKTGVSAFLPKGILPTELLKIIETINQEGYYFLPEQVDMMRTQIAPKAPKPKLSIEATLTSREKEVLQLICQQYTAQEIANKLFITKRTVEGHKNKLLSKIGVKNTAGLIIYAIQKNIVDIQSLQI